MSEFVLTKMPTRISKKKKNTEKNIKSVVIYIMFSELAHQCSDSSSLNIFKSFQLVELLYPVKINKCSL